MILNDNPKVRDWLGEHPDNVIVVHCKVTLMMVANKELDYKQNSIKHLINFKTPSEI